MILDFLPDRPGHQWDKPYKFLGYWHSVSVQESRFGVPVKTGFEFDHYSAKFGDAGLPLPHEWIDTEWDPAERDRIVTYLKAGKELIAWRGNSWCRFEKCPVDYLQGYRDLTDGVYVWPEAFPHYVAAHNVKPPEEFLKHALRFA